MLTETKIRVRNDAFLYRASSEARSLGLNESEMFERLVHLLLNWKDEMFQRELDARMNSVTPLFKRTPNAPAQATAKAAHDAGQN